MGRRVRAAAGVLALAEVVVFVLVANWIGLGPTILLTLATSALGLLLLGRQGTRALTELRSQAAERRPSGRALGDAGLVAVGGVLMVLPGFIGDVVGLLCLLPPTRPLVRGLIGRLFVSRLPAHLRGPVRVRSARAEGVDGPAPRPERPLVIEGEVLRDDPQH
ncbi:FxsA family protein [Blastococcus sp. URHD0036]|uniref:FxsA family protein n=1 Tax=Blastococcus sp. URHD0036 TaxID=1380356 RepID=UPI00054FA538|nr:FxsA family protein [Blastococcus sp. URHD0036]